jgi:hypothetical protein
VSAVQVTVTAKQERQGLEVVPSRAIPVQNIEHEAFVPSSFDWTDGAFDCFHLIFDLAELDLFLQETVLNENKKKVQTKRAPGDKHLNHCQPS